MKVLQDVLPLTPQDDVSHLRERNPELGREGGAGFSTGVPSAHISNVGLGQPSMRVPLAMDAAAFPAHVLAVRGRSAEDEMRRVHAGRVVTGVHDRSAFRQHDAVGKLIGKTMCFTSGGSSRVEDSVSATPPSSQPWPAGIGAAVLVDLCPETFDAIASVSVDQQFSERLTGLLPPHVVQRTQSPRAYHNRSCTFVDRARTCHKRIVCNSGREAQL